MGNDGGSIPKRRELVKEAARQPTSAQLKETAAESLTHAWTTCPLSSEPLDVQNTVADGRGILYNYESVLQCLLPSSAEDANSIPEAQEEAFRHTGITSARDVVRLRFALRRDDRGREVRACPVSLKELGAATKAVYLVPCGHVFAEAALRELTESASASASAAVSTVAADAEDDDARRCPECSEPFEPTNVIPVLPTSDAETAKLKARLEALKARGLAHNLKKDKSASKKKRKAADDGDADGEKPGLSKKEKREKERGSGIGSRINNSATASLTARVLAEQEESNKRRKLAAAR